MSDNNINIAQELLRLTRETIIYGFSGIAVRVAGIILVPFYTRTFSPEDYGIIELANTFIQIMVTIVILGLDYSSGYLFYQTQDQDRRKEIMGTTIGIQMALSLLFLIVGLLSLDLLKISLFGAHPDGRMLTILALLAIPLSVVFKFVQIMLRFLRKPKSFSALSVGAAIITIVLGILLVVIIRFGIIGAVVAVLLSNLLASFTGIVWIHHWVKFGIVKELVKPLLQIGLPLVPAGIAWWALTLSNRFFLRDLDSLGAVGILAVSSKVVMMSSFAVNAIQMSWGPFALSLKERANSTHLYALAFTGITSVICFATVAVSLLAPEIVQIGTSQEYYQAAYFVPYLGISIIATGLYNLWSTGATLAGKSSKLMEAVVIGAISNVTLNILLIKAWGIFGAVLASAISSIIMAIVVLIKSHKCWPIPYEKARISVILMGAICIMLSGNIFSDMIFLRFTFLCGYLLLIFFALKPSRVFRLISAKRL